MTAELKLDDVRLRYTDDVLERKLEVLRAARIDVKQKKLEGEIGNIGRAIGTAINKLKVRKKWPEHLVALSLEYITTNYCDAIYQAGAELSAEDEG